jgi:hypothetical protein
MSNVTDRAEELRSEAINILLAERQAIDEKLASLSYDGAAQPKKSHHKKKAADGGAGETDAVFRSENNASACTIPKERRHHA